MAWEASWPLWEMGVSCLHKNCDLPLLVATTSTEESVKMIFVVCFILVWNFQLHSCSSELLLPLDAVTLKDLRVVINEAVSVNLLVEHANSTAPYDNLGAVVSTLEGPVMHYSLLNATELEQGKLFSYTVSGLEQDMKYDLFLQANNTTISHSYSLVTTGLQSVRVILNAAKVEVVCEFLPASRADGCLIEWRPEANNSGQLELTIMREDGDTVSATFEALAPAVSYQVYGFGVQGNVKLHAFPITPAEGLLTIPLGTPTSTTKEGETLSFMVLVTILSAVLASVLVGITVLVCTIVAIVKCSRKTHKTMPAEGEEGTEESDSNIRTMVNICYGELLELQQKDHTDNASVHDYDDILVLKPPAEQDYENVDPTTGSPVVPMPRFAQPDSTSHDYCERACLPLQTVKFPASFISGLKRNPTVHTFQHKQLDLQRACRERSTLSVIHQPMNYEVPRKNETAL